MQPDTKKRPDPLPESTNEFWDGEVHTGLKPEPLYDDGKPHYFVRKTGRQAQCIHCDWGFELDPGDKIVDGHLYMKDGKLVV